ncbi:hypothetical protein J3458_019080 [Metarhizium acridum]|nr:hypothetical protein J3458_019080 [Metarhizium acridum]
MDFVIRTATGWAIHVDINPSYFLRSPRLLQEYSRYMEALRTRHLTMGSVDALNWLATPFRLVVAELAEHSPPLPAGVIPTLWHYLSAPRAVFQLHAVDENFRPVRIASSPRSLTAVATRIDEQFLTMPHRWTVWYHPCRVQIDMLFRHNPMINPPCKVWALSKNHQPAVCYFKQFRSGYVLGEENAKLLAQKKLALARGTAKNRHQICTLHGLVLDESGHGFVGMLFDWIDVRGIMSRNQVASASHQLRDKWAQQIKSSVEKLHSVGAVWGNAAWNDVLIDRNDNAWITGFGASYLPGWVDADKRGTVDGDLQGLEKILDMLQPASRRAPTFFSF